MKATHIDYLHPRHLRVEDGKTDPMRHDPKALCVAPSSAAYAKLNRPGLPKWTGAK